VFDLNFELTSSGLSHSFAQCLQRAVCQDALMRQKVLIVAVLTRVLSILFLFLDDFELCDLLDFLSKINRRNGVID
jgi:hypothetical protein